MQTRYEFINFVEVFEKAFTTKWICRNNETRIELGAVEWYSYWSQYCFTPASTRSVFSAGCLRDIADFIEQLKNKKEQDDER